MGRRSKLKGLDPNSVEYWNKLLAHEHLSLMEGMSTKLSYVGGGSQVEKIKGIKDGQNRWGGKFVRPSGHGPDSDME